MSFFDRIPPVAPTFEVAPDSVPNLSRWRDVSAPAWTEQTFTAALRASVRAVRPLARGLSAVLRGCDTSSTIGAALHKEREVRGAVDSLATDLLASALLLEALAGNEAAQTALDYLRRRRGLPQVVWRRLVTLDRSGVSDFEPPAPAVLR